MSVTPDFDELYREYHPRILRYVSRIAGPEESEDITQEVFEKAGRSLTAFEGRSSISTWLYRIATNTALDRMKSPSHTRRQGGIDAEDIGKFADRDVWTGHARGSLDRELIRKDMNACIREFIMKLPDQHRAVIILSELEGFKNREIADILDISLENVKIRLHRARARLRKEFEAGCDFYHDEQNIFSCDRKTSPVKFRKPRR